MTTSPSSDSDHPGLEGLYRANLPMVYRFCTARLGKARGEEAAADVFAAAALAFRDGHGHQVTPAWLMTAARNKVIDHWRMAGRRKAKAHLLSNDAIGFPFDWSSSETSLRVVAALDRCSDRHRAALIGHYVDGFPALEVAEMMSLSLSATESLLARARRAFRDHYNDLEERR